MSRKEHAKENPSSLWGIILNVIIKNDFNYMSFNYKLMYDTFIHFLHNYLTSLINIVFLLVYNTIRKEIKT